MNSLHGARHRLADRHILTINSGSSSIKFATFQVGEPLGHGLRGKIDRIGLGGTAMTLHDPAGSRQDTRSVPASDHKTAAGFLIDYLERWAGFPSVRSVGHRVVHGMTHTQPEMITRELLDELHRINPYDPVHLPGEIDLIEAFRRRHPKLPQV